MRLHPSTPQELSADQKPLHVKMKEGVHKFSHGSMGERDNEL